MAQPRTPALAPTQFIIIDPEGDLTVRIYKDDKNGATFISPSGKMMSGHIFATFKVSRKVLVDNSSQFSRLLSSDFMEARQTSVDIKEGTAASLEVCFRVLHDKMTDEMYNIPNKEVWEVIEVCGYRNLDITKLNGWFAKWWANKDLMAMELEEMAQLLFPCHEFDHAQGFQFLTRKLAYEMSVHITEHNLTRHHHHLHLEGNVLGSINGARGSLRSKLIRGLFDPVDKFTNSSCACKEKALFAYIKGLSKTGIWPLQSHHQKSIQEILESPGFLKFDAKVPEGACSSCSFRLRPSVIETIRSAIASDFDGLCLDCMDLSRSKTGDIDADYWYHDELRDWDQDCRIKHGQPTWYFSFMGRKADLKAHQLKMKRKRAARHALHYSRFVDSDYSD